MPSPSAASPARWVQLLLGLVVMMAISSPQYVWTLFVKPFQAATGAGLPTVQITFSILIVLQTLFSPAQGWLVDRFGPKALIAVGAALTGLGWVLSAHVDDVRMLFLTYGLFCGVGTGIVYVGVVGLMARWFPDRRGFAIGIVAAGYGMGAMLTTFPISSMLTSSGAPMTLIVFGVILGGVGVLAALGLARAAAGRSAGPRRDARARKRRRAGQHVEDADLLADVRHDDDDVDRRPDGDVELRQFRARLRRRRHSGAGARGLAVRADRGPPAQRIHAAFLRLGVGSELAARTRWASPSGWRRRRSCCLLVFRQNAPAFVALSGLVFFGWGEIFSLFPSTLTDTFGSRNATTNYGFLYIAQGVGSILGGPVAAAMRVATGSWIPVFGVAVAMDVVAALLALFVLKQMRAAYFGAQTPARSGEWVPAAPR